MYLFDKIEEIEIIEKHKIFQGLPYSRENTLNYIYYLLQNLFESIKSIKNNRRYIIIIDNIIDKGNLKNVIEDIISLKNSNRIKFILCGNGKYFNQKIY